MDESISIRGLKLHANVLEKLEGFGNALFEKIESDNVDPAVLRNRNIYESIHSFAQVATSIKALRAAIREGKETFKTNPVEMKTTNIAGVNYIAFTEGAISVQMREEDGFLLLDGVTLNGSPWSG